DGRGADGDSPGADGDGPWPPWALEQGTDRSSDSMAIVDSFIDEAEASTQSEPESGVASGRISSDALATSPSEGAPERSTASAPSAEIDGFELRGTPAVSRREGDDDRPESREAEPAGVDAEGTAGGSSRRDRSRRTDEETSGTGGETTNTDEDTTNADGFGTLSGTSETARIDSDSFGTALEPQSDDDRYRALGAALDAGGNVSVRGLLEDDEFLPELPAVESDETRIEFADGCAPVGVPEAATTEQSGFEWVDSGPLETTRLSSR
ncbi:hypothetical protein ACFQE6_25555, partial [Natrinema soli]